MNSPNLPAWLGAFGAAGGLTYAVHALAGAGWLLAWFVAVSLVTFAMYGADKAAARWRGWRVPELLLHALAVLGGSVGAAAGQKVFRHKTAKRSFQIVFWVIFLAQVALVAWLLTR